MTAARVLAVLLTLAACLGVWVLRGEIGGLRGTLVWDLRFVVLGCAAALALSLAERLAVRAAGDKAG
jgi:hypothetical protein